MCFKAYLDSFSACYALLYSYIHVPLVILRGLILAKKIKIMKLSAWSLSILPVFSHSI